MTPTLRIDGGGTPSPEEAAAIVAAAQAVISASRRGGASPHPAYVSPWWIAGRDRGLRRGAG